MYSYMVDDRRIMIEKKHTKDAIYIKNLTNSSRPNVNGFQEREKALQ